MNMGPQTLPFRVTAGKSTPYRKENITFQHYKDQFVNAVKEIIPVLKRYALLPVIASIWIGDTKLTLQMNNYVI
jgi:hypothetical protein